MGYFEDSVGAEVLLRLFEDSRSHHDFAVLQNLNVPEAVQILCIPRCDWGHSAFLICLDVYIQCSRGRLEDSDAIKDARLVGALERGRLGLEGRWERALGGLAERRHELWVVLRQPLEQLQP